MSECVKNRCAFNTRFACPADAVRIRYLEALAKHLMPKSQTSQTKASKNGKDAIEWLGENEPEGDVGVRLDTIDMIVVSEDRTLLRHHVNAFGEMP